MKTVLTILISTIVLLLVFIFLGVLELKKEDDLKQLEIDFLRARNTQQKDLFEKRLDLIRKASVAREDSMKIAHQKTLIANEVSKREISKLRKIIFVAHSDSSRTKELQGLYKSYTP